MSTFLYPHSARLVATVIIFILYWFAQLPQPSVEARTQLAEGFRFTSQPLPELPDSTTRSVRTVHPKLAHIAAWISSVGASVALNDLDGDGLPNDVCYVDTRSDQVIVAPVPATQERYGPFSLDPAPLPYDATMAPMGCLPGDLNEDGLTDILVYYWGRTPIAFLRQNMVQADAARLASDRYVRQEIITAGERWFTNAATFADLDGDGHTDLVIGNYFPDGSRILDATASEPTYMQHSMSHAANGGRKHLLLWAGATTGAQPTVHFQEGEGIGKDEVTYGWTLAVGAADLDGDLLPELYFANDFGPDRLLHNRSTPGHLHFVTLEGERFLTTPKSKVLGRDSFKGMGVDFGDLNGDGLLDIYVSNIAAEYALEESHFAFISTGEVARMKDGVAPYIDRSEELGLSRSGWGWDVRLDDFDNDGILEAIQATGFVKGVINRWPELHELAMGNDELLRYPGNWPDFRPGVDLSGHQPNPFFVRAQDGRYYDFTGDLHLDLPQVSRGIATADVDGDGALDFAVANQWERSFFYQNQCPHCGAFLGLHLLLPVNGAPGNATFIRTGHPSADTPGRPAIGAVATVQLPDGRQLVGFVDGGNGHSGKRSAAIHWGLGHLDSASNLPVTLQWRASNGQVYQETVNLAPGWHTLLLGTR